jgi:hypothetical protein
MNFATRKTVYADLNLYCHHAKSGDIVEVCEWTNGEGWDVYVGQKIIALSHGELQALLVLCNTPHPRG